VWSHAVINAATGGAAGLPASWNRGNQEKFEKALVEVARGYRSGKSDLQVGGEDEPDRRLGHAGH
jgi:hypothetical protein